MADRVRRVVLSIQDDFSGKLKRYQTEIQGAEKATASFANSAKSGGGLRQFNEQLHYTLQNAQQLYTAFNTVFSTADQWAQMGIGAERSKIALRGITDESEKYIDAIQRGTMGAVTQGEAAAQAYRLIRFGLVDSVESAEKFIHTMSVVAAINPQLGGTGEAINQIQLTLSNMSFMRLDQLGISAGQVRKRMAELKEETAGLSNEQAFQTAVMEQLTAQAEATGDSILGISDAQDRFRTRIRGFKEDIGLSIAEGFEGAAVAGESLIGIWEYFETHPLQINLQVGGKTAVDWAYAESKLNVLGQEFSPSQVRQFATTLLGPVYGQAASNMLLPSDQMRREFGRQKRAEIGGASNEALMSWIMAQSFVQSRPSDAVAPDYYSQWAAGMPSQYGTGRAGTSALASLQAPFLAGRQARQAGAFGLSEIQQQMEWIEKGEGGDIVAQFFGAIETGARGATSQIQAGTGALQDMVQTAESISFDSLEEKFGIDPSTFDTDVFNEMSSALNEAGVNADVAAEAMKRYELQIGAATGSSELFDNRMTSLADSLAQGKISAEEYVQAVTDLSQADYSWLDRTIAPMISEGDLDRAQRYIDIVSQMGTMAWTAPGLATPELGMGAEMGTGMTMPGGGLEGFQPAMTPLGTMMAEADELTQKFADAETDWQEPVTAAMTGNKAAMSDFTIQAIEDIGSIQDAFMALDGMSISPNVNFQYQFGPNPPAGPGGTPETGSYDLPPVYGGTRGKPAGGVPEFQHGGMARTRGRVDPGEYVVPQGGALVIRERGSRGAESDVIRVETLLNIDGQRVARAVAEAERRGNKGDR
jgi:hypothetical protein